jgi:hypothetical protein
VVYLLIHANEKEKMKREEKKTRASLSILLFSALCALCFFDSFFLWLFFCWHSLLSKNFYKKLKTILIKARFA